MTRWWNDDRCGVFDKTELLWCDVLANVARKERACYAFSMMANLVFAACTVRCTQRLVRDLCIIWIRHASPLITNHLLASRIDAAFQFAIAFVWAHDILRRKRIAIACIVVGIAFEDVVIFFRYSFAYAICYHCTIFDKTSFDVAAIFGSNVGSVEFGIARIDRVSFLAIIACKNGAYVETVIACARWCRRSRHSGWRSRSTLRYHIVKSTCNIEARFMGKFASRSIAFKFRTVEERIALIAEFRLEARVDVVESVCKIFV